MKRRSSHRLPRRTAWLVSSFLISVLSAPALTSAADAQASQHFDVSIGPQPVGSALRLLAEQTGLQVLIFSQDARNLRSPGVTGRYSGEAALAELLQGTGLVYEKINERTIVVRMPPAGSAARKSVAVADGDGGPSREKSGEADRALFAQLPEEVIVTGTHLRGVENSASPVQRFDRKAIEKSGYATTEQFIRSLPQNFGGGASGITGAAAAINGGDGSLDNFGQGTGANLRGLGNDATLVLVNGRRLAPVGMGNFVDLSMIPIGAVDRVEVLTDGASAVYGSDAVAGVVNFITRQAHDGMETRLRYGTVTDGGHQEWYAGQTIGSDWSSGSALLSYEYQDRTSLASKDRFPEADDVSNDPFGAVEIVPPEKRHGALLTFSQAITDSFGVYTDVLYGNRRTCREFFSADQQIWDSRVEHIGGAVGAAIELSSSWQADITGGTSRSETVLDLAFGTNPVGTIESNMKLSTFDVKADGTVLRLPGGAARLAVGGHYRRENYDLTLAGTFGQLSRNVRAAFGELFVPLVGAENSRTGVRRLEVTLSGRYEDYSDVGSTLDPKIGLRWAPAESLSLRGTFGTSFRAPMFREIEPGNFFISAFQAPDPTPQDPDHTTLAILLQGGSRDLRPQEAESWTAGLDFAPEWMPALRSSLTYFDIDFKDRIGEPIPTSLIFNGAFLNDPIYGSVVTRNPDLAAVEALMNDPAYRVSPIGDVRPEDIEVIVDNRIANIARRRMKGVDFSLSHTWETSLGAIDTELLGTYLLDQQNQVTPDAPFARLLNTVSFPVDLRVRNGLGWRRGSLGAVAFINYTDGYRDIRPGTRGTVSSWTTVDLMLSYVADERPSAGWLSGTSISMIAQNALDRDPPFAMSLSGNGIDFDPTNANPIGRFVALQLSKEW